MPIPVHRADHPFHSCSRSTEDWSVGEPGGATRAQVDANLKKWISGAKSPGLVILEDEILYDTVGAFMQAFPAHQAERLRVAARCTHDA